MTGYDLFLHFELARDTVVLLKGKPRCKYGLELHGDARLDTATARLSQVSRMLGACVPYFVAQIIMRRPYEHIPSSVYSPYD